MKEAYALGEIPTRHWQANRAYFHRVVFAYTLLNWFRRVCLPEPWQPLTLPTVRQRLLLIPGDLVRPQGKPVLKLPHSFPYQEEFLETLKRTSISGVRGRTCYFYAGFRLTLTAPRTTGRASKIHQRRVGKCGRQR